MEQVIEDIAHGKLLIDLLRLPVGDQDPSIQPAAPAHSRQGKEKHRQQAPAGYQADGPQTDQDSQKEHGPHTGADHDPTGQISSFFLHEYSFLYSFGFKPVYLVKVLVKYRTSL